MVFLPLAAGAAGALVTAWRRSIKNEIHKITELIDTELVDDEELRALARRIVEQYGSLGYAGRLFNSGAYEAMCDLCAANYGERAQKYRQFYACLARIRKQLRCASSFGRPRAAYYV